MGALIVIIVLVGVISSAQLLLMDDPGMGHMGSVPAIHFIGPLLGSILVASVLAATYVVIRDRLPLPPETDDHSSVSGELSDESRGGGKSTGETAEPAERRTSSQMQRHPILDLLPEDEEKILEPVIVSPGITQVEVADRSGFSRSKVSQTITALEKRGLLYRERQGRTYRVYPADDLDNRV